MLVDTDVLIDYLRGVPEAIDFLERAVDAVSISAVTVAELYQGVREGEERIKLATTLSALTVLPLTEEIAEKAGLYRREYGSGAGCGLANSMIGATANHHNLALVTLNKRHFPMVSGISQPYAKG